MQMNRMLQTQIQQLEEQLSWCTEEKQELEMQCAHLKQQLKKLTTREPVPESTSPSSLAARNEELASQLQHSVEELCWAHDRFERAEGQCDTLIAERDSIREERDRLQAQLDQMIESSSAMDAQVAELQQVPAQRELQRGAARLLAMNEVELELRGQLGEARQETLEALRTNAVLKQRLDQLEKESLVRSSAARASSDQEPGSPSLHPSWDSGSPERRGSQDSLECRLSPELSPTGMGSGVTEMSLQGTAERRPNELQELALENRKLQTMFNSLQAAFSDQEKMLAVHESKLNRALDDGRTRSASEPSIEWDARMLSSPGARKPQKRIVRGTLRTAH